MGKLGSHEFTTTSDVDIVLIYDADDMSVLSNGPKPLGVNHYYARLSQNFINSITALTGEGKLYEVDNDYSQLEGIVFFCTDSSFSDSEGQQKYSLLASPPPPTIFFRDKVRQMTFSDIFGCTFIHV